MVDEGGPEVSVENETRVFSQVLENLLTQTVGVSPDFMSQTDHEFVPEDELRGTVKPVVQVDGH